VPEAGADRRPVGTNGAANTNGPADADGAAGGVAVKPGRHREATLYHALHGAGAGDGRSLAQLREAALKVYEHSELPVWRRSGFWTTSFEGLDLDALQVRHHAPGGDAPGGHAPTGEAPAGNAPAGDATASDGASAERALPQLVRETLPDRARAGRIVQLDGSVVSVELDAALAERGVILCSLEQAEREHGELFARWYSKRLTYDRHKFEAANAAFWTGGAFLYVPAGVAIEEPFEIVYAIGEGGTAQYGRTLIVGERAAEFRVHEYDLAGEFTGQALHAGAFELYLQDGARCRLAQVQDWSGSRGKAGTGDAIDATGADVGGTDGARGPEVFDASTRVVCVGRDAYCHWLPALLGGHLVRQHLELAVSEPGGDMAFRGVFFAEGEELLDTFAVDLHETGPSGGDVHWRGAATGRSRASFEGLIQIDPGAQQTHTYLQIHSLMLSPKARIDAIPSVLVSADDVSASHGGTVGELDEDLIFYMQSRGLDRPSAVRVIVEGFFEPLLSELGDEPLEGVVRAKIAQKLSAAAADIEAYAASR
jgi:Fe-S cluster assembly protein SufD